MTIKELIESGLASSGNKNRVLFVDREQWLAALEAAAAPAKKRDEKTIAELKAGAAAADPAPEVGIHAHQLKLVLDLLPPEFVSALE